MPDTTLPLSQPGGQLSTARASPEAEANWRRYEYARDRGHRWYITQAKRCEGFYLGAGFQWSDEDKQALKESGGRPWYEWNEVMPAVNAAVGYQIHNRMDIAFLPRGGRADSELATVRTKVAKQICDANKFHWLETQVFSDGLIEQRGYYDIRMAFDTNVFGDVHIETLDPRDVVPDPDAKSYSPREWYDVCVTRWYSLDKIEEMYGKEARKRVAVTIDAEGDWGTMGTREGMEEERNKFADDKYTTAMWDYFIDDPEGRHYRIIDRQRFVYQLAKVVVYPTGEVKNVDNALPEQLQEYLAQGAVESRRMMRSVRWTVTTRWATLHDEDSPYDRFTVVPFFAYFRRGRTRGMVDNAISPQEALNKAVSQFIHILNTTANSGWIVEEESLVNMQPENLEEEGSKTGLLVIYKKGSKEPKKIEPNQVPQGLDRLIEHAVRAIHNVTMDPSLRGMDDKEESGLARQAQQFAAQQGLAIPLDNLARTRHLVAEHVNYLISNYIDNHRVFRITETDPRTGKPIDASFEVNRYDPVTKTWSNDMTEGEYDVVISEQPMQITFENSQFQQALDLRKVGVSVPDNVLVKHSNLADKEEILDQMANQGQPPPDPLTMAKTALAEAQAALARATADGKQADTVSQRVTSQFGAVQAAQAIAAVPAVAPLADQLLRSSGFEDQDTAPIVPAAPSLADQLPAPGVPGVPKNTSPQFPAKPANPAVGLGKGIEGAGTP